MNSCTPSTYQQIEEIVNGQLQLQLAILSKSVEEIDPKKKMGAPQIIQHLYERAVASIQQALETKGIENLSASLYWRDRVFKKIQSGYNGIFQGKEAPLKGPKSRCFP